MATAAPVIPTNNPAGDPPTPASFGGDSAPSEQDIMDVFDLDESGVQPNAPAEPAAPSPAPAAEPAAGQTAPAPAAEPPAEPTPAQPAAPEPAPASPPAAPAAPPAAPATPAAAPPTPTEDQLRTASLTAQVDALQRELEQLRANPTGAQPAQPSAESGQQGQEQPFRYNLTLPQPVQQALLSEDPQQNVTAITSIVNDLGTIVFNHVLATLRPELKQLEQRISSSVPDPVEQQRASAREQYYAAFPAHNNPTGQAIVANEATKLASEFPGLKWDATYINALGARVNAAIASLSGGAPADPPQPTPTPTPAPTPAPRPAAMLPSGQRGAEAVTATGDLGADIMDVLDPFSGD